MRSGQLLSSGLSCMAGEEGRGGYGTCWTDPLILRSGCLTGSALIDVNAQEPAWRYAAYGFRSASSLCGTQARGRNSYRYTLSVQYVQKKKERAAVTIEIFGRQRKLEKSAFCSLPVTPPRIACDQREYKEAPGNDITSKVTPCAPDGKTHQPSGSLPHPNPGVS